jgi:DMSO/TMAO reductase YedYZ molybdopterin-dependent catalytic subunit
MRKTVIKNILVWAAAVLMVLAFTAAAGCAEKESASATEAQWSITIKAVDGGTTQFTNEDAGSIDMVDVAAVLEKKDGSTIDENWKGIPLAEVLKSVGIDSYSKISVAAGDGYSQEYEAAAIDDPETILGFFLDGEEVSTDDGLVQLVVPTLSGKFWIKNVAVIEVLE